MQILSRLNASELFTKALQIATKARNHERNIVTYLPHIYEYISISKSHILTIFSVLVLVLQEVEAENL